MDPMLQPSASITPINNTNTSTSATQPTQTAPTTQTPKIITRQIRKGSRINFLPFAIGCMLFMILIFGGVFFVFISMASDLTKFDNTISALRLSRENAKLLMTIFAGIFFGIIFFLGMFLLGSNAIKMIGSKSRKGVYIAGIIFGLFIMTIAGAGGAVAFNAVNKIPVKVVAVRPNDGLIVPYVVSYNSKLGETITPYNNSFTDDLYGPVRISFEFNYQAYFRNRGAAQLNTNIQGNNIIEAKLDCGNGKVVKYNNKQLFESKPQTALYTNGKVATGGVYGFFDNDSCFYTKKGTYKPSIALTYQNKNGEKRTEQIYSPNFYGGQEIFVKGAIDVSSSFSNTNSEEQALNNAIINVGNQGSSLNLSMKDFFKDIGASKVEISFDNKGTNDFSKITTNTNTKLTYDQPGKIYTQFKLPGVERIYMFPVRVDGSDAGECQIKPVKITDRKYKFSFDPSYSNIRYSIDNLTKQQKLKSLTPINGSSLEYEFPANGNYRVNFSFIDDTDNPGSCNSEIKLLKSYTFEYKVEADYEDGKGWIELIGSGDKFITQGLAKAIRITTQESSFYPSTPKNISFVLDGQVLAKDKYVAQFDMKNDEDKLVDIITQGVEIEKSTKTITISPNTPDIEINLFAKPQNPTQVEAGQDFSQGIRGKSPLAVKLEATTSKLKDKSDKILYFTWDFGDGSPVQPKVSQGFANHTYYFDNIEKNGTFKASVTIETQKGLKATKTIQIDATQPVKEVILNVLSHTTQVATVGDDVEFGLEYNGDIKNIAWDFGDGGKSDGEGRSLIQATHRYTKPGTYGVNATLEFSDSQPISVNKTIKINE